MSAERGGGKLELQTKDHPKRMFKTLNVKALVGTFNQKKALVGAFSMILKYSRTFV